MRCARWLACLLVACSSHGHSLDRFDHAIEVTRPTCLDAHPVAGRWTCEPLIGEPPFCPCRAELELVGSMDGKDLATVRYNVRHCTHKLAVSADRYLIDWFPVKDLETIFDRPAGDDQRAAIQRVVGIYIRGDRVLDLEWTREAYRDADGTVQPQDLESYFVTIRPRVASDRARLNVETEPAIISRQKCPGD